MTFVEVNVHAVVTAFDSPINFHSGAYDSMVKKTTSAVSLLAINQNTSHCTTIIIGQLERDNLTLSCVAVCNRELYRLEMPALYAHVSLGALDRCCVELTARYAHGPFDLRDVIPPHGAMDLGLEPKRSP
jgi:hypothetical protein